MASFKFAVKAVGESGFSYNAQRFATSDEASSAGRELMGRWMAMTGFEIQPSEDPVNYRFDNETYRCVPCP